MLVSGGLGMLLGSGVGGGIGAKFLAQFLQPLSKNARAIGFIAQAMYAREDEAGNWLKLPSFERDIWVTRATNAVEAMIVLMTQSIAGKPPKRDF